MINNLSINTKEAIIIIKDFIKTYFENSGCEGLVIGFSGGIDSAVTSIICKKAIGKNKTKCLFLPEVTTPDIDIKHADLIVKKFDLNCKTINITPLVTKFQKFCPIKPDKLALSNMKARIRMIILFEYANMTNSLVCGTSNKSELLIGYFTKYGDGGSDIMPIGDLYKTQILEIAKDLNLPKEIIIKPPSAGLFKGQTDEGELKMKYKTLDLILSGLEKKMDIKDIVKLVKVRKSEVERIRNMRKNSQHKRRSPLIPKIGLRTPGLDWRVPIQEG